MQQICEQENKNLCQQVKRVADQVRALAQQRKSSDGNQDSIHIVIRTEIDEKIDKMTDQGPAWHQQSRRKIIYFYTWYLHPARSSVSASLYDSSRDNYGRK